MRLKMTDHDHKMCPQNKEFVKAVTDLATTVEVQANNVRWIEKGARAVAALCISVICLAIVGIFYAGALYQQVGQNTNDIREIRDVVKGQSHVALPVRPSP